VFFVKGIVSILAVGYQQPAVRGTVFYDNVVFKNRLAKFRKIKRNSPRFWGFALTSSICRVIMVEADLQHFPY
jgi:hypothetical protein